MASINSCHLLGNLTRDPEVRYTPKGSAVCDLSLACNRVWYDEQKQKHEECDFIDITIFGKTAENVGKYTAKGLRLHVEGRLKQDTWDDKTTGQKRSKLKVIADKVTFIDFKESDQPRQDQPARQAPAQRPAAQARPAQGRPASGRQGYFRQQQAGGSSPFVDDDGGDIPY